MKRVLTGSLILIFLLFTAGCVALVAGVGVGAGAYTYVKGELTRNYQADYDSALNATRTTLKELRMQVVEEISDGITTEISALRADKTPIRIHIERLAPRSTRIGIRSGIVGLWDKKVSILIHDLIAKKLFP